MRQRAVALARKAAGQVGGGSNAKTPSTSSLNGSCGLGGLIVIVFETEWECRIQRMKGGASGEHCCSKGAPSGCFVVDSDFFFLLSSGQISTPLNISRRTTSHKTLKRKPTLTATHTFNHTSHRFSVQKMQQRCGDTTVSLL